MARGPETTTNGQIQRGAQAQRPEATLVNFIEKHHADLAMVLPKHITPDRMARLAISAVRTTRGLDKCSLVSFASSIMACSALGLEPNTPLGHAYLVPFKGECTLIVGYKGLIDLMYRSGLVSSIKAEAVFKGDTFEYEKGLNPKLRHIPCGEDDPDKLTHVYTVVRWKDGGDPIWDVLTREQVLKHRGRSASANASFSPWKSDFVAMALKTGVRAIAKWAPSSTERIGAAQAVAFEQANELGRPGQAIAALGAAPVQALEAWGATPSDEPVPVNADGEVIEERQSGED